MTLLLPAVSRSGAPQLDIIHCVEALELLRALPDGCVDAVITDPPYGIGIDEWDKPIDIVGFIAECWRVIKNPGFLAFFGQMPTLLDWMIIAKESPFQYKDHVVWVKRMPTTTALDLNKAHENILVYRKGKANYFQTKGRYEDVNLPGLLTGVISIEAIDRHIKDLRSKINGTATPTPSSTAQNKVHTDRGVGQIESDRSPEFINFKTTWSFLPENMRERNGDYLHPTRKPEQLMIRLIELLTPENAVILDPFLGSGTTALAARNTGRHYICGDSSLEYVAIAKQRLAQPYTPSFLDTLAAGESREKHVQESFELEVKS